MVSSVEQLFNVFQQQTEKYQPEQYRSAQKQSKYASEQIAQLLNIEQDLSEELEGNILLGMGQVKRFFSFDNQTIEQLPECKQNGHFCHLSHVTNTDFLFILQTSRTGAPTSARESPSTTPSS